MAVDLTSHRKMLSDQTWSMKEVSILERSKNDHKHKYDQEIAVDRILAIKLFS